MIGRRLFRRGTHGCRRTLERGVTSIEYGLIATGIAVLISAGVMGLGPKVLAVFASIVTT